MSRNQKIDFLRFRLRQQYDKKPPKTGEQSIPQYEGVSRFFKVRNNAKEQSENNFDIVPLYCSFD